MWPILIGGTLLSVLAFVFLGSKPSVNIPDEPDDPDDPDDDPDEPDEPDEPEGDDPDEPDNVEPDEPDPPKPPKIDESAVYVNADAQRAAKRKARVPKVRQ